MALHDLVQGRVGPFDSCFAERGGIEYAVGTGLKSGSHTQPFSIDIDIAAGHVLKLDLGRYHALASEAVHHIHEDTDGDLVVYIPARQLGYVGCVLDANMLFIVDQVKQGLALQDGAVPAQILEGGEVV